MDIVFDWHSVVTKPEPGSHIVQFYKEESFLTLAVVKYFVQAFSDGCTVVSVATKAHQELFEKGMKKAGVDLKIQVESHRYIALDAEETLAQIMLDGTPDKTRFNEMVSPYLQERSKANKPVLRIYGEMVDLLWRKGNHSQALLLEQFWADLGKERAFCLFFAYQIKTSADLKKGMGLDRVCSAHTHVITLEDYSAI